MITVQLYGENRLEEQTFYLNFSMLLTLICSLVLLGPVKIHLDLAVDLDEVGSGVQKATKLQYAQRPLLHFKCCDSKFYTEYS